MDNKKKAAELIVEFLPIVGQDVITGLKTARECAKVSAKIAQKAQEDMDFEAGGTTTDWDDVIKQIDTF